MPSSSFVILFVFLDLLRDNFLDLFKRIIIYYIIIFFYYPVLQKIFIIFLLIGFIISYFVKSPSLTQNLEKPNNQTTAQALFEAFKTKSYLLLISGFFVCGFHITLVGTHVPKYVIDRGLENWTAAAILSLIGLFNIFGSLLSGYLSTKISKKIILSSIYFLRGISIILFIFLPASNLNAFIFGASFGFLWLSTVPATSGIVAHLFGTKYLGLLYGIVFLSHPSSPDEPDSKHRHHPVFPLPEAASSRVFWN